MPCRTRNPEIRRRIRELEDAGFRPRRLSVAAAERELESELERERETLERQQDLDLEEGLWEVC